MLIAAGTTCRRSRPATRVPRPRHRTCCVPSADAFPGTTTSITYGSTEAGTVCRLWSEDLFRKPGSVGLPAMGSEVRLAENGEILVRNDMLMNGYFRDPEATAAALEGGWFHTGDLGVQDDEGYFSIVGRAGDVIRTGGEAVAPVEVDLVLQTAPGVADAAVAGTPDENWGEVICAFVVPRPGATRRPGLAPTSLRGPAGHVQAPAAAHGRRLPAPHGGDAADPAAHPRRVGHTRSCWWGHWAGHSRSGYKGCKLSGVNAVPCPVRVVVATAVFSADGITAMAEALPPCASVDWLPIPYENGERPTDLSDDVRSAPWECACPAGFCRAVPRSGRTGTAICAGSIKAARGTKRSSWTPCRATASDSCRRQEQARPASRSSSCSPC